jgi:hypothetical protein
MFADNLFDGCPYGIYIGRRVQHTILWNNTYAECKIPVHDGGLETFETGNIVGRPLVPAPQ